LAFHIAEESLDWAVAHVTRFGDTDIFPPPFEFDAINHSWSRVKAALTSEDLDLWLCRPHRVCLTPKGRYAYRISTQLDPFDSLVYCALVYEIGRELEAARVRPDEGVVCSYRFDANADGQLFSPAWGWRQFIEACRTRSQQPQVTHVVVADISDFFHRLSHHRIQNALDATTGGSNQARIISKLIDQWAGTPSYGIPVGPSPSRLVAEVAVNDVDRYLAAEGADFCRFSDDFRIFCISRKDAYDKLSALAMVLFENHGLTLQPGKTKIMEVEEFSSRYLSSPESEELNNLVEKFEEFLELIELSGNWYDQLDYEDLEPDAQQMVDEFNLEDLLRAQLSKNDMDLGVVRFILRRMAQLNDSDMAVELIDDAERCYPVLAHIMEYLTALTDVPQAVRDHVSAKIMSLIRSSAVAHLPYHRCWLMTPFAASNRWDQTQRLATVYNRATDTFTRRKTILALGRASQDFWFRARRNSVRAMDPWERRAFLAGASCLPHDERRHWYRSVRRWLDPLDAAVVDWVTANPI